jgi:hypothetical protein
LRQVGEVALDAGTVPFAQQAFERLLDRAGDEAGADFQVPDEPAQGQPVDQGHDRVRDHRERDQEGDNEPERKPHAHPQVTVLHVTVLRDPPDTVQAPDFHLLLTLYKARRTLLSNL